jgi:hypothetical protein
MGKGTARMHSRLHRALHRQRHGQFRKNGKINAPYQGLNAS